MRNGGEPRRFGAALLSGPPILFSSFTSNLTGVALLPSFSLRHSKAIFLLALRRFTTNYGAMRGSALPLLVLVAVLEYSNARLSDWNPLGQQNDRPGLVNDIRTAWNGLLGYSSPSLLQTRDLSGPSPGKTQCLLTLGFSHPALINQPGNSGGNSTPTISVPVSSGGHATATTAASTSLPSSIWRLMKTHVSQALLISVFG